MPKNYYHNYKTIDDNIEEKNFPIIKANVQKKTVDINMLLNRVKIEKKTEITQKIIYYSLTFSLICLMGIFIAFVR